MTKDVIVSICGLQNGAETDGQPIEMIIPGEYFYKNEKHYILYEEIVEGETKTIKNRIKIGPGMMELTKRGMISTQMLFEENKKNITHYYTPYGGLEMGIDTKRIEFTESDTDIEIQVDYALEMNQEFIADCDIKIHVKATTK